MPNTPRLQQTLVAGSDNPAQLRIAIDNNATITDNAVTYSQGTISTLPAAALAGRRYYATDVGIELYDTGTQWIPTGTPTPIGAMTNYAGSSDPIDPGGTTRWLVCDGRAISRTTYTGLFGVVSTTYGAGDGSTTFNIPDLRGRVAVGADASGVHLPTNHPALGAAIGEEVHLLSSAEMPVHSHNTVSSGQNVPSNSGSFTIQDITSSTGGVALVGWPAGTTGQGSVTGNAGSGSTHNNLQPSLAVNHIIRVL